MDSVPSENFGSIQDENTRKRYTHMISTFKNAYNKKPEFICRAPGRVNLIGEHIDYCGYSVLPMAIMQDVSIAVATNNEDIISITNVNKEYEKAEVKVNDYQLGGKEFAWFHYVLCGHKGVCSEEDLSSSAGLDLLVDGCVPKAAGMSSSSALVCSSGLATAVANHVTTDKFRLAELCARCERFIGTQGGGMDQSISFLAEQGKAKIIGFNPLTVDDVTLPEDAVFVVANSRVKSEKAITSHFNVRVAECKLATQVLAKLLGVELKTGSKLYDLQQVLGASFQQMLKNCDQHLHKEAYTKKEITAILKVDERSLQELYLSNNTKEVNSFKLYQRAKHVFSEAARVMEFRSICGQHSASNTDDVIVQLGKLMNQSHESCSKLYECSCDELDHLTHQCREAGALGSRMTGAGWGGCTVSLVRKCHVDQFMKRIRSEVYADIQDEDQITQLLFSTSPSQGAVVYRL